MIRNCYRIPIFSIAIIHILYMAWLCARVFLFDYFTIPSVSMTPTIQPGNRVVVNKLIFGPRIYTNFDFKHEGQELESIRLKGFRNIKHNDIIVFNFPVHKNKVSFRINHVYCKRVVGLPGDTVSSVKGQILNNNNSRVLGLKERQKQLQSKSEMELKCYGVFEVAPRHVQTIQWNILNWGPIYVPRKHDIAKITPREATIYKRLLEWETGCKIQSNWEENKVLANGKPLRYHRFKHNYYHVCGDNSLDSYDSRYWGFVPEEYIVGIVARVC